MYVDGFVLPVPKRKLDAYKKVARKAGRVWIDHGALAYVECAADDLKTPVGTPFDKRMRLKPGETVIFSWILYTSRGHRNRVNKLAMNDKRLTSMDMKAMPFDARRMSWAGFKTIVKF